MSTLTKSANAMQNMYLICLILRLDQKWAANSFHGELFFSSCSRGAWIMFPGSMNHVPRDVLHWATLIIHTYHVMLVGPIMIGYFR